MYCVCVDLVSIPFCFVPFYFVLGEREREREKVHCVCVGLGSIESGSWSPKSWFCVMLQMSQPLQRDIVFVKASKQSLIHLGTKPLQSSQCGLCEW